MPAGDRSRPSRAHRRGSVPAQTRTVRNRVGTPYGPGSSTHVSLGEEIRRRMIFLTDDLSRHVSTQDADRLRQTASADFVCLDVADHLLPILGQRTSLGLEIDDQVLIE